MNKQTVLASSLTVLVLAATAACANSERAATPGATTSPAAVATAVGATATGAPTTASPAPPTVVKEILDNDTTPPGAPDRTLSLVRYTIPAGAKLAPHVHPGVQMASIESGTLTYTVISGTAQVRRAGASADTPTGPGTIQLGRGDAVTEVGDMVHFGENKTDAPVIILATLLTEHGHELAEPVPAK